MISGLLRMATIDKFQGEEAKVVIILLVRSNKKRRISESLRPTTASMFSSAVLNIACILLATRILTASQACGYRSLISYGDGTRLARLLAFATLDTQTQISKSPSLKTLPDSAPRVGRRIACDGRLDECAHQCQAEVPLEEHAPYLLMPATLRTPLQPVQPSSSEADRW